VAERVATWLMKDENWGEKMIDRKY